jgi:phosphohistidine phosphatase
MQLLLLRHGEAEYSGTGDASRKLTEVGHENNLSTARQCWDKHPDITHAYHSPYLRAEETAADLISVFSDLKFETSNLLTPDSSIGGLLSWLEQFCLDGASCSVLLVGHNPLLSNLVNLLLDESGTGMRSLDTSDLVCLNLSWPERGCGELIYWLNA